MNGFNYDKRERLFIHSDLSYLPTFSLLVAIVTSQAAGRSQLGRFSSQY